MNKIIAPIAILLLLFAAIAISVDNKASNATNQASQQGTQGQSGGAGQGSSGTTEQGKSNANPDAGSQSAGSSGTSSQKASGGTKRNQTSNQTSALDREVLNSIQAASGGDADKSYLAYMTNLHNAEVSLLKQAIRHATDNELINYAINRKAASDTEMNQLMSAWKTSGFGTKARQVPVAPNSGLSERQVTSFNDMVSRTGQVTGNAYDMAVLNNLAQMQKLAVDMSRSLETKTENSNIRKLAADMATAHSNEAIKIANMQDALRQKMTTTATAVSY